MPQVAVPLEISLREQAPEVFFFSFIFCPLVYTCLTGVSWGALYFLLRTLSV